MSWDAIAAIGQMLGSIAVFVTLGYLAAQVRQAKQQMQRAVMEDRAATARQLMLTQLTDERLSDLFEKVNRDNENVAALAARTGLSYSEALSFNLWQVVWWQYRALVISHIDDLPSAERGPFDAALRMNYQEWRASASWYEFMKPTGILNLDAVRYIDNLLGNPV